MGRAPCCEKKGLKKGPWNPEEDHILISHIQKHGHENWRALPKQAGLLRCGKSCRLRWTNYLRPDIKRGNYTKEEEETIINLHEVLGNRWSAIAARLPGRTDNEIKNVWHTHLKKKLKNLSSPNSKRHSIISKCDPQVSENSSFSAPKQIVTSTQDTNISGNSNFSTSEQVVTSPRQCSSDMSNVTDSSMGQMLIEKEESDYSSKYFPHIDESFWFEELSIDDISPEEGKLMRNVEMDSKFEDGMEFWYNIFIRAGEMADLSEF